MTELFAAIEQSDLITVLVVLAIIALAIYVVRLLAGRR